MSKPKQEKRCTGCGGTGRDDAPNGVVKICRKCWGSGLIPFELNPKEKKT